LQSNDHDDLKGLRILVVEDDPIIALDLCETLSNAGATPIGPAHRVGTALHLIDHIPPDLVVLDWQLETETVSPVAHRLTALSVPFLFHTSSGSQAETCYPGIPIINKPTRAEQLLKALRSLVRQG
jgi:DNA-binding response OmpR family regulator